MAIPLGYEMQIRSRSGLCVNNCVMVMNSPATIDWDYRGEIKVILYNLNKESFVINKGDRIAQAVFAPVIFVRFNEVDQLTNNSQNTRGEQGFGSSGTSGESHYQEENNNCGDVVMEDNCSDEETFTTECNM
jgi:dUTP pyrophosphatase